MRTSTIKSIAALALTGAGSALVLGFRTVDLPVETSTTGSPSSATGTGSGATTGSTGGTGSTGDTGSTSGSTSGSSSGSDSSSGSATAATYADGTWTGRAVQEPWGAFQVAVTVADGSIVGVKVVEAPTDRHSTRINNQAVPILTESVVASQGQSIDLVSGATWTSDSYATSLQSALDEAAAAA